MALPYLKVRAGDAGNVLEVNARGVRVQWDMLDAEQVSSELLNSVIGFSLGSIIHRRVFIRANVCRAMEN